MKSITLLSLLNILFLMSYSQQLEINIAGIKSTNGVIRIAVYQNQTQLEADKGFILHTESKAKMKDGKLSFSIKLPSGTYGISVLDDTNSNAEMDYGLFGIPKEGYAFSNYVHSGMSYPKFTDFSFDTSKSNKVFCKMKYL